MKNLFFTLILSIAFFTSLNAQTLVSTDVQKKNAVLEEFTGIYCGYCPQGHAIAQQLIDDNPGRAVVIAIHTGDFANPNSGEPDFRTPFGDAIAAQTGLTGYPAGTINRHLYPDLSQGSGTAMGRGGWTTAASRIFPEDAPVNVGASTSYNSSTRELTVNVELYYTGSTTASNFINVALLQSNILGPQSGGGMGNNYVHKHMLRHLLTGQWGDEVTTTSMGTFIEKTYTYTVPADYNGVDCVVEDCDIAVFVTESQQEILNGIDISAIDGTTLITASMPEPANTVLNGMSANTSTFDMNITSNLAGDQDFLFTLTKSEEPADWTSSATVNSTPITTTTVNLPSGTAVPIQINVTPGAEAGFAKYILSAKSITQPNTSEIIQTVYLIANTETLIVNNQGSWDGGTPADLTQDYLDALDYANATKYTSSDYRRTVMAADQDKLGSVKNIFFNVAWTFPSLTNENVAYLSTFLDNGGNLFIAGQDIGWDTWDTSNGGNGTTETQAFYTNYLNANYQGDGSTSDNSINANDSDPTFGTIGTSTIVNIYGGTNMYPDEINAIGNGSTIFYYNNGAKSSGVKSSNGTYKTVYLGFDPSMVSDVDVRKEILKTTYNWFMSSVGVSEISNDINVYPNPAKTFVTVSAEKNSQINIFDISGKLMLSETLKTDNQKINIQKLNSGIYFINVNSKNKIYNTKIIVE